MALDDLTDLEAPATYRYVRFRFRLLIWLPLLTLAALLTCRQAWASNSVSGRQPGNEAFAELALFLAVPFLAFAVAEGTKRTCFFALLATCLPLLVESHLLYTVVVSNDLDPTRDFTKALFATAALVTACAIATRSAPRGVPTEMGRLQPYYWTNPDL